MSHLKETGLNYFRHMRRAFHISFVSFVHGIFPNVWTHKVSDIIKGVNDEPRMSEGDN